MLYPQFIKLVREDPQFHASTGLDEVWRGVIQIIEDAPNLKATQKHLLGDRYEPPSSWRRNANLQHAADEVLIGAIRDEELVVRISDGSHFFRLPKSAFQTIEYNGKSESTSFTSWSQGRLMAVDTTSDFQWIVDAKLPLLTTPEEWAAVRRRAQYVVGIYANEQGMATDAFPAVHESELIAFTDSLASRPYWTLAESLLWIGFRDMNKIAQLILGCRPHFDRQQVPRGSGTIVVNANTYCREGEAIDPDPATSLVSRLRIGDVNALGRFEGRGMSSEIPVSEWMELELINHPQNLPDGDWAHRIGQAHGVTWRDHWADLLFDRESLWRAFSAVEGQPARNRQLNHEQILASAKAMREGQPNISIGSAAASIVADLPPNKRTGKPRSQRNIENIIGPLWRGAN